jgi:type IX secretion system PorP/SprF family membrane protein
MSIKTSKMKYLLSLCMGLFLSTVLLAQQKPEYTQYILNQYILNPALSGIDNYTDIKASSRIQWVGINGAPVTTYLTIQGPIGKADDKTTVTTLFPNKNGENPLGKQYWEDYKASPPHHGIGLQVINDQTGPFNNFSVFGTYAYHIPLSPRTNLSAGIGLGASNLTLDQSKLNWGDNGAQIDQAVQGSGQIGKTHLDANAGLWLYSADYFIGFSALQLLPQKIVFTDKSVTYAQNGKLVPHYFFTTGYRFMLNDDINVVPSIMVKDVSPVPVQVDFNVKMEYQDLVWIGATYRDLDGFDAMLGFNAGNLFTFSYSYDYTTTAINTVSSGTHEIIIGFILGNGYGDDTCPRNVW